MGMHDTRMPTLDAADIAIQNLEIEQEQRASESMPTLRHPAADLIKSGCTSFGRWESGFLHDALEEHWDAIVERALELAKAERKRVAQEMIAKAVEALKP